MSATSHNVIGDPAGQIGRLARLMSYQARLWRFCARRLHENNLFAMSAALSFRTIFALIPALVLAFLAAGALGFVEDTKHSLRSFLQASGFAFIVAMPSSQPATAPVEATSAPSTHPSATTINIADELEGIFSSVQEQLTFRRIGPIGAALFIWSALSLIATMEGSLNRVFGAVRSRSLPRRVLLYWSTMTLGPVAIAITAYCGQRAITVAAGVPVLSSAVLVLGWIGPVLVAIVVLAAIYTLVPNTHVDFRLALGGAAAFVALWLIAKWAFALYVEQFVLKGNLYGILGAFPLFMMWLNYSWMIFLFGAELTHTAANLERISHAAPVGTGIVAPGHAVGLTVAVARAYGAGSGPVRVNEILSSLGLSPEGGAWLLERLVAVRVLCPVRNGPSDGYVLARPPEHIRTADLLALSDPPDLRASTATGDEAARLAKLVQQRVLASVGNETLADVLAQSPAPALQATGETELSSPGASLQRS